MRPLSWTSLVLGLSASLQLASARHIVGITDIQVTTCPQDDCQIPGYRKIPHDLNKFSRGSFVHLHFTELENLEDAQLPLGSHRTPSSTPQTAHRPNLRRLPITDIHVLKGEDADMGPDWERVQGNLNDGNRGPVLTLFVKRDPKQAPITSVVVKYGFDSHAAIGYDLIPMDLNAGTGGQWVHLYYKRAGRRDPITHIATKACMLPPCTMDESWTRINRPIVTGTIKRYLYIFYKSVPGERPITRLSLSLKEQSEGDTMNRGVIDTGVRYKNQNVYVTYERGSSSEGHHEPAIDNIAIEIGSNPVPYNWNAASFEHDAHQEPPDWNVQLIFRTGNKALPTVPKLRFREDESFKIVQFADIHMATGQHSCYGAPLSMACKGDINTIEMMERVLEAEKPDLVVYTGDNVDGLTSKDAYSTILKYSKPVIDRHIPWTIIFGNHDEEGDLTREEMMSSIQDLPYSLSQRGPLGISGTGNYHLSIYKHKHDDLHHRCQGSWKNMSNDMEKQQQEEEQKVEEEEKSSFTLYFLDSGAYSFSLAYPGWDWIKEDQVEWFRQTSRSITSHYPKDQVPNALAFFHIPIPEYALVDDDGREDEKKSVKSKNGRIVGDKNEGVSAPSYNSGMFEAFFESKDVRATTVGHDHLNDYCLDHRGINLCFGGGLGYGSYGSPNFYRRSRVFEIRRNGDRVDTWKRLDDDGLTLVGLQTLFVGKKSPLSSGQSQSSSSHSYPRTGPARLTDDLFEGVRVNAQHVLDGLGNH